MDVKPTLGVCLWTIVFLTIHKPLCKFLHPFCHKAAKWSVSVFLFFYLYLALVCCAVVFWLVVFLRWAGDCKVNWASGTKKVFSIKLIYKLFNVYTFDSDIGHVHQPEWLRECEIPSINLIMLMNFLFQACWTTAQWGCSGAVNTCDWDGPVSGRPGSRRRPFRRQSVPTGCWSWMLPVSTQTSPFRIFYRVWLQTKIVR